MMRYPKITSSCDIDWEAPADTPWPPPWGLHSAIPGAAGQLSATVAVVVHRRCKPAHERHYHAKRQISARVILLFFTLYCASGMVGRARVFG
jgi:hypothetical protein